MAKANINQIISYGIQNRKSKDEIFNALLKANADLPSAITLLDSMKNAELLDYEGSGFDNPNQQEDDDLTNKISVIDQLNSKIKTVDESGKETDNKGFRSAVGMGFQKMLPGWLKPGEGQFAAGSKASDFEALHNQLIGILKVEERAKLKGSGTISDAEQKMLAEAVAALNLDSSEEEYKKQLGIIRNVLDGAAERKKGNTQSNQGIGQQGAISSQPGQAGMTQGTTQSGEQVDPLQNFNATLQYAQQNPDDERSQKFLEMIKTGQIDPTTGKMVEQTTPLTQSPTGMQTQENGSTQPQEEKKGIGEKIGQFLGGDEIGKGIGNFIGGKMAKYGEAGEIFETTIASIEKKFQDGRITQEERDKMLKAQEANAKEAFGYDGPSFLQLAGDAGQIALTVGSLAIGGAGVAGAAGKATQVGVGQAIKTGAVQGLKSGASYGAGFGFFGELQKDKEFNIKDLVTETAKSGIIGGAFGGVVGGILGGATGVISNKINKNKALNQGFSDAIIDAKGDIDLSKGQNKKLLELAKTQGFNERDVKFFSTLSDKDKVVASKMLKLAEQADNDIKITKRPIDMAGDSVVKKLTFVDKIRNQVGKKLSKVATGLRGKKVDTTPIADKADELFTELGIKQTKKGLDYSKSVFKYNKELQNKLNKFFTSLPKGETDAYSLHITKKAIDEVVDYGTAGEGLKGQSSRMLKALRATIDGTLDSNFPKYEQANTEYKMAKELIDQAQELFGKKNPIFGKNANIRAGQVFRSAFSNNTSRGRVYDLAEKLDNFQKVYKGGPNNGNALDQALFAERLEKSGLFDTQAITGFAGQIQSAVKKATTVAEGLRSPIKGAGNILAAGVEKMQNISPEEKKKILMLLIR